MNQEASYALLAADSYRDARSVARNYAPIDPAWIELKDYAKSGSGANAQLPEGGFSARVYRGPGGEIVISYAGTQFGGSGIGQAGDWLAGNYAFGIGAVWRTSRRRRRAVPKGACQRGQQHHLHGPQPGRRLGGHDGGAV